MLILAFYLLDVLSSKQMKKLRAFFYSFKRSLVSPDYYRDVIKTKFSFSLKFFLFSCFLLSLILGTVYSLSAQPALNKFVLELKRLPGYYPENLVIEIKNGQVNTNQKEPFFVPLPPFPGEGAEIKPPFTNLLVIDTQAEIGEIKKYQTAALLTKDSLVIRTAEQTQELRAYPLDNIKDFTLDENLIQTLWQKISIYFKYMVPLATTFIFLGLFIGLPLSKFIHLVIFSLITLIFAKILKAKLSYKKSLQVNLHAFILPTLVQEVFKIAGLQLPIPFFYSLVLLIFNLIILASLKEKKA